MSSCERIDAQIAAVKALHRRSFLPAGAGMHKGRHYCMCCTTSVDDFTAFVDWPCQTMQLLGVVP